MSKVDERVDDLLLMMNGGMKRRIILQWINPALGDEADGSPVGLYPGTVVAKELIGKVVVIIPEEGFKVFLEAWKAQNINWFKKACRMFSDELRDEALRYLRFLEVRQW